LKLNTRQGLDLLRQVANAICYAHRKRVVHRALCPQSILVTAAATLMPKLQVYNWQVGVSEDFWSLSAGVAKAASSRCVGVAGPPPRPVVFRADHPFLFFIRDSRTLAHHVQGLGGRGEGSTVIPPENRTHGHRRFYELLEEAADLHEKKVRDYGDSQDPDPLYNLRNVRHIGVDPVLGVLIRMNDKFSRIRAFVKNGCLTNERLEDTLMDIAAYAFLCIILAEEAEAEKKGDKA
jgi:hypothetical protein